MKKGVVSAVVAAAIALTSQEAHGPVNPISAELLKAIAIVESSGNPKARSKKGAWGLMQIRHAVWTKELKKAGIVRTKHDLFDPHVSTVAATYILTRYHRQTKGDMRKTLEKYSGGARGYANKVFREMGAE